MNGDRKKTALSEQMEQLAKQVMEPRTDMRSAALEREFPSFFEVVQGLEREREVLSPDPGTRERIRQTLFETAGTAKAPVRPRNVARKWMFVATAACFLFVILPAAGFSSPTMAEKLKSIPLIRSVFSLFKDETLHIAGEKGLVAPSSQSVTVNGIIVTMNEVFYDGSRIDIGYAIQMPETANETEALKIARNIKIWQFTVDDSDKPVPYKGSQDVERVDGNLFAGIKHIELREPLPDKFTLHAKVAFDDDLADPKTSAQLDIPVVKQMKPGDSAELSLNISKTMQNGYVFEVESVKLTPASTTILLKEIPPDDKPYEPAYRLLNDKGEAIEEVEETLTWDEKGIWRRFVIPLRERPESVKLIPSMNGVEETEKAVTIPLKADSQNK
ncbi:DUF4179 domain-containing protein [Brevibacillus ruminantium]|uniref:DUF4179 domain-containing protein n=1 Tax=Brevibacillus ruminantium TaxID=2950604 RepID=A0ABY4WIA3_9BACL|nr:DUF4179 domain-containing protein [Brevibacillus ruminantium]USG65762.1 DUF4179 domain-containing protein [Brevibacillus ruminantium]